MTTRIAIRKIRIEGLFDSATDNENQVVHDEIDWAIIEEFVDSILPEGYYCKIED